MKQFEIFNSVFDKVVVDWAQMSSTSIFRQL